MAAATAIIAAMIPAALELLLEPFVEPSSGSVGTLVVALGFGSVVAPGSSVALGFVGGAGSGV